MRPLHHLRHLLILFIGAFAGLGAKGQTYYYVDQIVVAPASPTTADAIGITLNGSLSNTASFIMNTGFTIVGSTVQLNVNAAVDGIGLDVLVPHSETFNLGMLAAGTYTIVISGTATLDMAAGPEHHEATVLDSPDEAHQRPCADRSPRVHLVHRGPSAVEAARGCRRHSDPN